MKIIGWILVNSGWILLLLLMIGVACSLFAMFDSDPQNQKVGLTLGPAYAIVAFLLYQSLKK